MSWRHLHGRAEVDPRDPQPFGICQRCGIQYNLEDLSWQHDYRGARLTNTRLLVCRRCKDEPAEFTVPLCLPQDPEPISDARPELYSIDED